ncbi:hypothetical protein Pla110_16230 [Polystyrenella longa]|uniref:Glycerophosphoryl diester phosphodiesterase membrane domain-containing protein n=1 Tax=Polystyrenella longa TaxID=2528007 RepID=A0A518CL00_9PLAN|nr:DUF6159 family protein [Polystyrenella longa]QDU79903.1 hypothetical protein Pla110_16230 [Polystyrenella longa]
MSFFSRIGNTWELMGASWDLLKQDKELLFFPIFSSISCLLVSATFLLPFYMVSESFVPPSQEAPLEDQIFYYLVLFLFYVVNYFVMTYFNAAVIGAAIKRMMGDDPTMSDGFRFANKRLSQILGWAIVSATVGLILRLIEDRSQKIGAIVAGLLGAVWTLSSFLVIPILVVEGVGPIDALTKSTKLLKKTWGEQLVSNFGFGVIFFFLSLPLFLLIGGGVYLIALAEMLVPGIALFAIGVVLLILLGVIQTCLQSIFQAALYVYIRKGHIPGTRFHDNLMQNTVVHR